MAKRDILDTSNLFFDLAHDLDTSITTETGKTLSIMEFVDNEIDLGIELSRNQKLILKITYNYPLTEEDISILQSWKVQDKTGWDGTREVEPQVIVLESGRRCLIEDTKIQTPTGYTTFKCLAEEYLTQPDKEEAEIDLKILRSDGVVKATKLYRYYTNELIEIETIDGHSITGTPQHRLLRGDKEWVPMSKLTSSDELVEYKNLKLTKVPIKSIKKLKTTNTPVYDLHVPKGNHYLANGIVSHNSGKSSLAAIIAAYEFYCLSKLESPQKHYGVATSTPIGILVLATTAEQARKNIFRQILQILRNSEYFQQLERKKLIFLGKEEIAYDAKGIYVQAGNSRSAAQVGGTLKCFILDEASRFLNSDGESNALNLWKNIGISCAPFGKHAKRIAISSAWCKGDAIEKLYESAKNDSYSEAFKLVSWDLNTNINKENPMVAYDYSDDPIQAALEYEGIRPATVDAFLDEELIDEAKQGKSVIKAIKYSEDKLVRLKIETLESRYISDTVLHIDPSIKGDNYGLAFGHSEFNEDQEQIVVIDGLLAWQPDYDEEVSITDVGNVIREINRVRPIRLVTADHYNSAETIQRLKQDGISSEIVYFSNRTQLMMYTRLKTLLAENRLILPKDSQWIDLLIKELKQIQLISNKKIDHPKGKGFCFVGDTEIPLLDGSIVKISELDGKQVEVYSCDIEGNVHIGRAKGRLTTYVNELLDVILDNGHIIRCTPEHRFMLITGEYIEAKDISPETDKLMYFNLKFKEDCAIVSTKQGEILTDEILLKEETKDIKVQHNISRDRAIKGSKRVVDIIPVKLKTLVPVYDLEVEKWSNFALGAGIFVHNSKDLADAVAAVAYNLSEMVLVDSTNNSSRIIISNNNNSYEDMSYREKALYKSSQRKSWATKEWHNSKRNIIVNRSSSYGF